jgi:chaperonin GroEL
MSLADPKSLDGDRLIIQFDKIILRHCIMPLPASQLPNMPKPTVLAPPHAPAQLQRGFAKLAELLALTLGPVAGHVVSTSTDKPGAELLTDAATVARRLVALPDRAEDVGAMLLRNLVWRVHERVGDGAATTAVLAQAMLSHAARGVRAGANAVTVQGGLRRGAKAAVEALQKQARPVRNPSDLVAVALAATGHPALSAGLGEMYARLGPRAHILIEKYVAPYLECEYLEGGRWSARLASPYLITEAATQSARLAGCRVALFHGNLGTVEEVLPLLELAAPLDPPHLLLVANQISGEALNTLVATHRRGGVRIVAAALKRLGDKQRADYADLAAFTGAQVLSAESGESLRAVTAQALGFASEAEAGPETLGVKAGPGTERKVRAEMRTLEQRLRALPFGDAEQPELQMRIGRLAGSAGVLKIGAYTQAERDWLYQKSEQATKALAAALEEGVLPGGGAAYARCVPAVEALRRNTADEEEKLGLAAVTFALEAPLRRILANARAGEPGPVLAALRPSTAAQQNGRAAAFDVLRAELVTARSAYFLDSAKVLRVALETAASGALLALSTDAIVLKRRPKVSYRP